MKAKGWLVLALVVIMLPGLAFAGFFGMTITYAFATQAKAQAGGALAGGVHEAGLVCSGKGIPQIRISAGKTLRLSDHQVTNAAEIIQAGRALDVPVAGMKIAVMVALDESGLRNLANTSVSASQKYPHQGEGSDHDSVGVFQQRSNWGSVKQRMQVGYEARAFFGGPSGPNHGSPRGLLDVRGWQQLTPAQAAQAVQVSADASGSNYARWRTAAWQLVGLLTSDDAGGCHGQGEAAATAWHAPNGRTGQDLVDYAEQFVGKVPYTAHCGAAGNPTVGWCCTGFVYYVYNAVLGLKVPGAYVRQQLTNFHRIPAAQAQAGDVVAWPNQHIGIYDGHGGVIHSPDFGRMLTHTSSLFDVDGISPVFYRANDLGSGKW